MQTGRVIPPRRALAAASSLVLALSLTACGSDDAGTAPSASGSAGQSAPSEGSSEAPATEVTEVTITSTSLSFDVTEVTVPAGVPVTFTYDNQQDGVPHNLHVTGEGVDEMTDVEEGPVTQTLTVTFPEPGTYGYVCDVHPQQMQGVVTVV